MNNERNLILVGNDNPVIQPTGTAPKIICLHHNDLDGLASAAIVARKFPTAQFIEMDYAKDVPFDAISHGDEVIIVDFSLQQMGDWEKLFQITDKVTWIDHHESAIKAFRETGFIVPNGILDTRKCAALLTWDHYFPSKATPKALRLIDQWDRGIHRNSDDVLNLTSALMVHDLRPNSRTWTQLFFSKENSPFFQKLMIQGEALRVFKWAINKRTAVKAHEIKLAGHKAIAVNTDRSGSEIFSVMPAEILEPYELMVCYGFDGRNWTVHVYSDPEVIKANEIAETFGGGGHPGAAGFVVPELPWLAQGGIH